MISMKLMFWCKSKMGCTLTLTQRRRDLASIRTRGCWSMMSQHTTSSIDPHSLLPSLRCWALFSLSISILEWQISVSNYSHFLQRVSSLDYSLTYLRDWRGKVPYAKCSWSSIPIIRITVRRSCLLKRMARKFRVVSLTCRWPHTTRTRSCLFSRDRST